MEPVEILRPLIHEHFDFLISKHGFVVSKCTVGNVESKSCCVQYESKNEPALTIRVGTWFPDYVMELHAERSETKQCPEPNLYDAEEINRALNGEQCQKLLNHSCYSYDEEIISEVLRQMAGLLAEFITQVFDDADAVFGVLEHNRARYLELNAQKGHNLLVHRSAQEAWDRGDYSKYLEHIGRLTDPPNAIDQKRIYIAMKEYGNHPDEL